MRGFRYLLDPICLGACGLYFLNQYVLKRTLDWPLLHSWWNDALLIPAALPPVLWCQRRLRLRGTDHYPTVSEIVGHLVLWTVVCEWLGPLLVPGREGDGWDVLAYTVGAIVAGVAWHGRV